MKKPINFKALTVSVMQLKNSPSIQVWSHVCHRRSLVATMAFIFITFCSPSRPPRHVYSIRESVYIAGISAVRFDSSLVSACSALYCLVKYIMKCKQLNIKLQRET